MWFILAISNAALIGTIIVLDKLIVDEYFTETSQGLFITIPSSILVSIAIFPFYKGIEIELFSVSFLCGVILQLSQYCYFSGLSKTTEEGMVSAIESTYPALIAIGSIFIGMQLGIKAWIGIGLMTTCAFFLDAKKSKTTNLFYVVMIMDAALLAIHGLIINTQLSQITFFDIFLPYNLGIILSGLVIILGRKKSRNAFFENWHSIKKPLPMLSIMELMNIIAIGLGIKAISIGHPAMATAVMATSSTFVFLLSFCREFKNSNRRYSHFIKKIFCTLGIALGTGLLF